MVVSRHLVKNPQIAVLSRDAFYARTKAEGIPVLASEPYHLGRNSGVLIEYAAIAITLDLPRIEILKDLRNALLLAEGHWIRAGNPNVHLLISFDGHEHTIPQKQLSNFVSLTNWIFAGYLAIILRESKAIANIVDGGQKYFGPNFENLATNERTRGSFFRAIFDGSIGVNPASLESYESESEGEGEDYLKCLKTPLLDLWRVILFDNPSSIDSHLNHALELHKVFWGSEKNRQDKYGWISLPLLAACAYAHDHKIAITVESDYIPAWLYRGEFL